MDQVHDSLPAGLVRSDPTGPGHTRRRQGRGFRFLDATGAGITDADELARIKALVIPPAWKDVWISADAAGHIQAVGTDAAGRRQYRYHDDWRTARDREKHDRVLELGAHMADVREEAVRRLGLRGLIEERVLAGAVRMLDIGVFRAGGDEYAPTADDDEDEGSFGLATIRRDHVRLHRGAVEFRYTAKGGIERTLRLPDRYVHRLVGGLLRRRGGGEDLLVYRTGRSSWHDVHSGDLNRAVKELAGEQYTSKDLRTWNATVLAAATLAAFAAEGIPKAERGRKRVVTAAVKTVAEHLGNTPTVARASYVDPRVLERFEEGRTVLPALRDVGAPDPSDDAGRAALERAVVDLLTE